MSSGRTPSLALCLPFCHCSSPGRFSQPCSAQLLSCSLALRLLCGLMLILLYKMR